MLRLCLQGLLQYVPSVVLALWNGYDLEEAVCGENDIPMDKLRDEVSSDATVSLSPSLPAYLPPYLPTSLPPSLALSLFPPLPPLAAFLPSLLLFTVCVCVGSQAEETLPQALKEWFWSCVESMSGV